MKLWLFGRVIFGRNVQHANCFQYVHINIICCDFHLFTPHHLDSVYETNVDCFSDHRALLFKCNSLIEKQVSSEQKTTIDFDKYNQYDFDEFMNRFTQSVKLKLSRKHITIKKFG